MYVGGTDYAANRGRLYRNISTRYDTVHRNADYGFFEHNRSHGVVAADFDADGDMDLIVGHSRNRCDATANNAMKADSSFSKIH